MSKLASSIPDAVFIDFHFLCVWVFCPQRPKEGISSLKLELNVMNNSAKGRSWTPVLLKSYKIIPEPSLQLPGSCLIIGLWYHPVIKTVKTSESLGWRKGVKYKTLWEVINVHICVLKIHMLYHVPWPWSPPRLPGLEEESPRWRFHSVQLCAKGWSRSREREKSWVGMRLTLRKVIPN